jgi:hypothetical protein
MLNITNNGHSATAVPRIKGTGVSNRHAAKRQRAALAAAIAEGDTVFEPSMGQLSRIFGVNLTYIALARKFSPAKRKAVISGKDEVDFSALLNAPKALFALPPNSVSDTELETIIRRAGIERTLNAASAVEIRAS